MRFVVYGAGAVGGVIGARLYETGHDVTLIARGAHLQAILEHGLRLEEPDDSVVCAIQAVGSPAEAEIGTDDVVVMAMKTQNTPAALDDLGAVAPADVTVVCAQNGVANERMALRHFVRVYGVAVLCPATFLEPGVVQAHSTPIPGLLDIGRIPSGVDERAEQIADAFGEAGFESVPLLGLQAGRAFVRRGADRHGGRLRLTAGRDTRPRTTHREEHPMEDNSLFWRRFRCRFLRWHDWRTFSNPDGQRYRACSVCDKDQPGKYAGMPMTGGAIL